MRLLSVGDIHGCAETLKALLEAVAPQESDHIVFIGDYVDRGPDSKGVIDQLIELSSKCKCTFLRGNHEAMMLDFIDNDDFELWEINGGIATLNSYRTRGRIHIPDQHIDFLYQTESYLDHEDYFFVHAGIKPGFSVEDNKSLFDNEVFLWERSHLTATDRKWEKPVVCGHTPQREVVPMSDLICIDTGCVYHNYVGYGRLAAIELPSNQVTYKDYIG